MNTDNIGKNKMVDISAFVDRMSEKLVEHMDGERFQRRCSPSVSRRSSV